MVELSMVRDLVAIFGVLAGLSYYIITVRNHNRARQIQIIRGLDLLHPEVGFLFWEYGDYDDLMSKYGPEANPEGWDNLIRWLLKNEELGVYAKEGLLDIRLVYLLQGGTITKTWELLEVLLKEFRIRNNWPRWFIEAEYLCKRIIEYGEKHPELNARSVV
ncbi:MAG: DUF4760 domain-containing protein [Candidatus Thorarchaeota archaeon]|jgi:hypothetical protein